MRVEVVRSPKRRKTVELKPTSDGVRISIPSNATKDEEERYVRTLLRRYEQRHQTDEIDLSERARLLSARYGLETPSTIRWADNQHARWGSCTPATRTIRISSNVAKFPSWVLDYVIVHELAHLSVSGHGSRFWNLVERYPKTERARGYLIAKGIDEDQDETSNNKSSDERETGEESADSEQIDIREEEQSTKAEKRASTVSETDNSLTLFPEPET